MSGVWQTIVPVGRIKSEFNAIVVADIDVLANKIDNTILHSLRGVVSFMLLNLRNPILLIHESHSTRKVSGSCEKCSHAGVLKRIMPSQKKEGFTPNSDCLIQTLC